MNELDKFKISTKKTEVNSDELQESYIKTLKNTVKMYENLKTQTVNNGKYDSKVFEKIEEAKKDVIQQLKNNNVDVDEVKQEEKKPEKKVEAPIIFKEENIEDIDIKEEKVDFSKYKEEVENNVQYEIISLPSNGECYPSKKNKIAVSYLTAYDENLLTSPNLYQDGLIIDYLLHQKVIDKDIDVDTLCTGDVDAIILWLRATGYGPEFPVIINDNETEKEFESVIDLTELKTKKFKLKGDENGYFDYETKITKDKLKFRFLTRNDERILNKMDSFNNVNTKKMLVNLYLKDLMAMIDSEDVIDELPKEEKIEILEKIEKWNDSITEGINSPFHKIITNRMEMCIMSVNGNTDREYIKKYIKNMNVRDSLEFRKYVIEHEPGIDFNIKVNRPKNLGGGSVNTFLKWDDSVFYHII